jgi:hypothetical protein
MGLQFRWPALIQQFKRKVYIAILLAGLSFSWLSPASQAWAQSAVTSPPLLIITSSTNPFTRYYTEILTTEGFPTFTTLDISSVTPTILASTDVAILGEMSLTSAQVTLLSDWVAEGGNLIVMRPDKNLAGLLGLADASETLNTPIFGWTPKAAQALGLWLRLFNSMARLTFIPWMGLWLWLPFMKTP